ncbi:MAG: NAD-dependent epimerase/dehydratase family protein [Candidatus Gottesmanbacteria bacterium]
MQLNYKNVIYHPIISRIVYDSGIVFVIFSFIYFVFHLSNISVFPLYVPLIATLLIVGINTLFGIYSFLATAPIHKKISAIILNVSVICFLLWLCTNALTSLFITAALSIAFLILPRLLFNFYQPQKTLLTNEYSPKLSKNNPILVVGGGGYIGSCLVRLLLSQGYRVRVFDTFYYNPFVFNDISKTAPLEIIQGDVTDIYQLTLALQNAQAVIHLAGLVGDPSCSLDRKLTKHINISSTRMLKEAAKAFGIQRFIFASSCSVYGTTKKTANEETKTNPLSLYAETKLDSEKELLQDPYDHFHPTVLRLATVFGHSPRMRFDLIINLFTAQAYINGKLTVHGGNQIRPFIHVKDVAQAILLTLEAPISVVSRQILNVGDTKMNYSINELATIIASRVKTKKHHVPKIVITSRISDPRNYQISFQKIRTLLHFSSSVSLEQGMKEIADHLKQGSYTQPLTNKQYNNAKMTGTIQKKFITASYQRTHYASLKDGLSSKIN